MFWYFGAGGIGKELHKANIVEQVETDSDRAVGLVAGAIVERYLEDALKSQFVENEAIFLQMFRPSGVLGPFSVKIDMMFLTGAITADAHKDLLNLKNIRNDFAHELTMNSFANESIASRCANFTLIDRLVGIISAEQVEAIKRGEPVPADKKDKILLIGRSEDYLKKPRNRYVITTQLFSYYLAQGTEKNIPKPFV